MISLSNLYEGIDQIMSFCRGREELLSEQKNRNTYIYYKLMVILLILSENFCVTFFAKDKNILVFLQCLTYQSQSKYGFLHIFSRYFYMIR